MTQSKIYFSNLDGWRFICFLSVFFYHSFHTEKDYILNSSIYKFIKWDLFGNGNLGVNFFFVLSGFLITYLLISEKDRSSKINLKNFWMRRVLRIWPLFYFSVFFGFVIFPLLKSLFGQIPNETADLWSYLVFLNNFNFIEKGLPDASILGVLWSVAIEEQFYFVWPILLLIIPIKRYWLVFIFVILQSWIFRALKMEYLYHEFHTLSCIGDMAIGGLGAWLVYTKVGFRNFIINLKTPIVYLLYLIIALLFLFRDELYSINSIISVLERSFVAIIFLLIILEQSYSKNSFYKMSNNKIFSKLGKYTYGMYCLHFIGILITTTLTSKLGINTRLWQVLILETSVALLLTILISRVSWEMFEKHFLKLKNYF
ncbi:acyltransferase [Marivirga arenosa]|uniref:Acyltransferase n=1 Tax=Marivirga arenosa TaxID=3059076 RepID=A0AA51N8J5_9BACT|nr:acyltransferase [Marivirga sp. ABR2-2]WMN07705.1 acyltransferase [Marivirga sp. ABR2-2]